MKGINNFWKEVRHLASVVLVGSMFSCAALKSGLEEIVTGGESRIPEHWRQSSFFEMPSESRGDIALYVDYNGRWSENDFYADAFFSINVNDLQFPVAEDEQYKAEFTLGLQCYNKNNEFVFDKVWDEVVVKPDYEATRADNFLVLKKSFTLSPGEYTIKATFDDKNAESHALVQTKDIVVEPVAEGLSISGLAFADYVETSERSRPLNREFQDALNVAYDIRNSTPPADIMYTIFNEDKDPVLSDRAGADAAQVQENLLIDVSDLPNGIYLLGVDAMADSSAAGVSRLFRINRSELDLLFDFDYTLWLIKQYVPHDKQLFKQLEEAEEGPARQEAFYALWKEFDPTPLTKENEFLDEFAERVTFADRHLSGKIRKGSNTDMGRVFICLGPPNYVDQEPMPGNSKPYEIWEYDRKFPDVQHNVFWFYDPTGVGIPSHYRIIPTQLLPSRFIYE